VASRTPKAECSWNTSLPDAKKIGLVCAEPHYPNSSSSDLHANVGNSSVPERVRATTCAHVRYSNGVHVRACIQNEVDGCWTHSIHSTASIHNRHAADRLSVVALTCLVSHRSVSQSVSEVATRHDNTTRHCETNGCVRVQSCNYAIMQSCIPSLSLSLFLPPSTTNPSPLSASPHIASLSTAAVIVQSKSVHNHNHNHNHNDAKHRRRRRRRKTTTTTQRRNDDDNATNERRRTKFAERLHSQSVTHSLTH